MMDGPPWRLSRRRGVRRARQAVPPASRPAPAARWFPRTLSAGRPDAPGLGVGRGRAGPVRSAEPGAEAAGGAGARRGAGGAGGLRRAPRGPGARRTLGAHGARARRASAPAEAASGSRRRGKAPRPERPSLPASAARPRPSRSPRRPGEPRGPGRAAPPRPRGPCAQPRRPLRGAGGRHLPEAVAAAGAAARGRRLRGGGEPPEGPRARGMGVGRSGGSWRPGRAGGGGDPGPARPCDPPLQPPATSPTLKLVPVAVENAEQKSWRAEPLHPGDSPG